jgi:prolipoprotein diacylglyceryltransferase
MCGNVGEKYGTVVTYLVFLYTPGRFALERLRDAKFAMSTFLVVH